VRSNKKGRRQHNIDLYNLNPSQNIIRENNKIKEGAMGETCIANGGETRNTYKILV
jgi:hypothetical protein